MPSAPNKALQPTVLPPLRSSKPAAEFGVRLLTVSITCMMKTFDSFRDYCRSLKGKVLHTGARAKPFRVEVEGENVFFIPDSSGKRRTANSDKTERVLALLAESNEWTPGTYQAITYHASYILAIAKHASA